jgi:hypothetical protein
MRPAGPRCRRGTRLAWRRPDDPGPSDSSSWSLPRVRSPNTRRQTRDPDRRSRRRNGWSGARPSHARAPGLEAILREDEQRTGAREIERRARATDGRRVARERGRRRESRSRLGDAPAVRSERSTDWHGLSWGQLRPVTYRRQRSLARITRELSGEFWRVSNRIHTIARSRHRPGGLAAWA